MLEEHLTKIESSYFGDNPQTIILYNIIQDQILPNYLQKVVVEKVLNHAIFNIKKQCHHTNNQLLLYIRGIREVRKSKIIKAFHLEFCFLKRQKKLIIAA